MVDSFSAEVQLVSKPAKFCMLADSSRAWTSSRTTLCIFPHERIKTITRIKSPAQEMLEEEHEDLEHDENDNNLYSLGRIGDHNIVIVCLPAGLIGNNPAAAVASQMKATLSAVAKIRASHLRRRGKLSEHVSKLCHLPEFTRDTAGPDVLFEATYN